MAITPDKAAIEAAGLEYVEPTELVSATGPKALNLLAQAVVDLAGGVDEAEVRAIVEGMDLGGGSGVREVSGTVTLTTADGPLVQVYATAAATVNGESLIAGDVAVFRLVAGKWEVRILDVDFEWRVVGTAPVAPPEAIEVTAQAPTWTDDTDIGGGTWSVPALEGITYSPVPRVAASGETVTVRAVAMQGYTIVGESTWSHTFPLAPGKPASNPSVTDAFDTRETPLSPKAANTLTWYWPEASPEPYRRTTDTGDLQWGAWSNPFTYIWGTPVSEHPVYSGTSGNVDGRLTGGRGQLELAQTAAMIEVDYAGSVSVFIAGNDTSSISIRIVGGKLEAWQDNEKTIADPVLGLPTTGQLALVYGRDGHTSVYVDGLRVVHTDAAAGKTGTRMGVWVGGSGSYVDNLAVTYL